MESLARRQGQTFMPCYIYVKKRIDRVRESLQKTEYIYEDSDIIVCHKPAGIATEGAKAGQMDIVSSVRNYLARKGGAKAAGAKPPYVGTVYRLDQPVEGIVVLCKTKAAASKLAKQIKEHTTDKYYYAVCCGNIPDEKGHLVNFLIRKKDSGLAGIVSEKEAGLLNGEAKRAELDYEVVWRKDNTTLLRIKLLTGRFHQIRVQLSGMGFPILGDLKYGTKESIDLSGKMGIKNIRLCCCKFGFVHPSTGKRVSYEIEPEFVKEYESN